MFLKKKYLLLYIANIILFLTLIIALIPLVWLIQSSFKSTDEIMKVPPSFIFEPSLENYRTILANGIVDNLKNTIIIAGFSTLISLLIGIPAAYSLSRLKPKGYKIISLVILGLRFIPLVALTFPLFIIFANSGLVDTEIGLIIAYQIICLPLSIWLTKGFFDKIPPSVEEAARIDGCSDMQIFWHINLPIAKGPIIAVTLLVLIAAWNNLFIANVLARGNVKPLTVGMQQFLQSEFEGVQYGAISAWGTVTTIPIITIALIFNKYLIKAFANS